MTDHTIMDARYDAARQTNAAPCRGWDFTPSPPAKNRMAIIVSAAVVVAVALVVGMTGVV